MQTTNRLYYTDSYLKDFDAKVVESSAGGQRVYLDRTAFYPTSGGQPFDLGKIAGITVQEVVDEGERIAHLLATPLADIDVEGNIDWDRRFDHMQQHTGQHLLSAVFANRLHANTVSFHLGAESSTIDLAIPALDPSQVLAAEKEANQIVFENRPVTVEFPHASEVSGLRKPSEREGVLRVISIFGLDRSACGGTHVAATGEIGPILIRKLDKIRGNVRVEFLCGMRAIKRARADFDSLSRVARVFSSPLDDTPSLTAALVEKSAEADKALRKLTVEFAQARGRELYNNTIPDATGLRRVRQRVESITDELRAEARSFTGANKAVMLVLADNPPSALLASSPDSGWNAGRWLKDTLAEIGGRGGGTPTMAQGSLPGKEAVDALGARF